MEKEDFKEIVAFCKEHCKGIICSCDEERFFHEYEASNNNGSPTEIMQELCQQLINNGSLMADSMLEELLCDTSWHVQKFMCSMCGKTEIVFFSSAELERLARHEKRELLITDAIPDKPQWIRETFLSGLCLCPPCWEEYFS